MRRLIFSLLVIFCFISICYGYEGDGLGSYKLQRELRGNLQNIVDLTHISYDTGIASGPVIFKNRADFDSFVGHWGDPNNYWVLSTDEQKWVVGGLIGMNFIEGDIDYLYFGDSDWDCLVIGDTTTAGTVRVTTYTYSTHDWEFPHNVYVMEQFQSEHLLITSSVNVAGVLTLGNYLASPSNQGMFNLSSLNNRYTWSNNVPYIQGTAGVIISGSTDLLYVSTFGATGGIQTSDLWATATVYCEVLNAHEVVSHSSGVFNSPWSFNRPIDFNDNVNFNGDDNSFCDLSACGVVTFSTMNVIAEHHEFAEINTTSGTTAITLTTQNQWYQVKVLTSTGSIRGLTTSGNKIIVSTSGIYLIIIGGEWSCSAKDKTIEYGLFANNMVKEFGNVRFKDYTNGANTPNVGGKSGLADLAVGDTIEIWVRCTCSGGNTITPRNFSLIAIKQ